MRKWLIAAVVASALTLTGAAAAALYTFGSTDSTISATKDSLDANELGVSILTSPKAGTLNTATGGKVEGYFDGLGKTTGSEKVRMVIYTIDANNNPTTRLGVSAEQVISAGAAAGWRSFSFPSAISIPAGKIGVGYWAGGTTQLIRPSYDTAAGTIKYRQGVTYSSTANPPSPFGTASTGSQGKPWAIRVTADDGTGTPALPRFGQSFDGNDMCCAPAERKSYQVSEYQSLHVGFVRGATCGNPSGGGSLGKTFTDTFVAAGMKVVCTIAATASWDYPTSHPTTDMGSECTTAALNYPTAVIEPFNEPDLHGWLGHFDTLALYQQACYNAVKAANPAQKVSSSGFWDGNQSNTTWIDNMQVYFDHGGGAAEDIFSFHCYNDPQSHGSWSIWDMMFGSGGAGFYDTKNVKSELTAAGLGNQPVICTEGGDTLSKPMTQQQQATIYQHSMDTVDGLGTGSRKLMSWTAFTLFDDSWSCCSGFGELNSDRTERLSAGTFRTNAIAAGQ